LEWLIARVDAEVSTRLKTDAEPLLEVAPDHGAAASGTEAIERLDTIPGVGRRVAEVVVAEIGRDMSRFPSADHLASWAGLVPGHHESAGKRLSGRTRKGSPALRVALVEAARAAARTRTYLAAQFRRLAARRGAKRAAIAVAHSILVIAYHLLRHGGAYEDLGQTYFDERDRTRVTQRLLQRLRGLGLVVEVQSAAAP
jgi:transposase